MSLFSFKDKLLSKSKDIAVGVDIGSRSVKIVELKRGKDKLSLNNYVIARANNELIKAGTSGVLSESAEKILRKSFEEAEFETKVVNVSVPSFASLVTTIEIPKTASSDIESIIRTEAPKYIPVDLSEVVYDWQLLDSAIEHSSSDKEGENSQESIEVEKIEDASDKLQSGQGQTSKVLVVAILKEISNQFGKVFSKSDLELDSLEIDSFSLIRSLIGNDKGCFLVLDIGRKVTNILIVSEGNILINRAIDIAGDKITGTIAQSLDVDFNRAEKLKIEKGFEVAGEGGSGILSSIMGIIVGEVERTIGIFRQNYPKLKIEEVVLSGGTSKMKGILSFLKQELEIEVIRGNPFSNIEYSEKLKDVFSSEASTLSVAIGLAMLGFDSNEEVNKEELKKKEEDSK